MCAEKDKRISDLKEQITQLRALVSPSNDPNKIPIHQLEADAILSGQQHVIEVNEADMTQDDLDAAMVERSRLLSGNY